MNLSSFFLTLLLSLASISSVTSQIVHVCHHDKLAAAMTREVVNDSGSETRNLAKSNPRQFKLTYNPTYLDSLPATKKNMSLKASILKVMRIVVMYFNDLLTILPRTPYMIWDFLNPTCGSVVVPDIDKTQKRDSDLHLYLAYTISSSSYLAFAGWCRMIPGVGATHGQVTFNIGILGQFDFSEPALTQYLVQIVIHEIVHVLGFEGDSIQYWLNSTKKPYKDPIVKDILRGNNSSLLATPHVLEYARLYYNCTTLKGMPLENQGSAAGQCLCDGMIMVLILSQQNRISLGSDYCIRRNHEFLDIDSFFYFQVQLFQDCHVIDGSYNSKFTTALLLDTGYYSSVSSSLEESIYFGRGEGCQFVSDTCQPNKEFCVNGTQRKCDFSGYGVSSCRSQSFLDSGCLVQVPFDNGLCLVGDKNFLKTPQNEMNLGVNFGLNSRCFISSLSLSSTLVSEQGLCYTFSCSEQKNRIYIRVGKDRVVCKKDGQSVRVPGWNGSLKCPSSISDFCRFKGFCKNHCSSNGYCRNETCKCLADFTGSDCRCNRYGYFDVGK